MNFSWCTLLKCSKYFSTWFFVLYDRMCPKYESFIFFDFNQFTNNPYCRIAIRERIPISINTAKLNKLSVFYEIQLSAKAISSTFENNVDYLNVLSEIFPFISAFSRKIIEWNWFRLFKLWRQTGILTFAYVVQIMS